MAKLKPYLLVMPFSVVLLFFVGIPLAIILIVSFFDYEGITIIPRLTTVNYSELLDSKLTYVLYWRTLKYAAIVWFISAIIGIAISQFLVFHVRKLSVQIALFLLCTIPFWTSSIIRMISWLPMLGRDGLINQVLTSMHILRVPYDGLIYSDLGIIIAYVHSFSLFMIVPIFNSMARISPVVIEAAREAGASRWQIMTNIVIPLSKTGIALGSIFIVALVMGDFFIVKVIGGGQKASVALAISNEIGSFQYPQAAADSVIFLAVVLFLVIALMRFVDVRKELVR
jgi:putative spermidine/putrescine transport system permease protein